MKKVALIYPGQGSQIVGMGKEFYESFSCAREVMQEIDETLKQKLSILIFEGPINDLTLTENAQPALLAVSMMIQRVIEQQMGKGISELSSFVAGHSLGEYSALCASKVLSLSESALLVKIRGNAMQQAIPVGIGAMAAILGLEMGIVEEITFSFKQEDNLCVIANDNSPGQVVISGHTNAVSQVIDIATSRGAKRSVFLPVSAPFHSPLMDPAARVVDQAIDAININPWMVPIASNVTAKPIATIADIHSLLVQQITGRVRWRELIENLVTLGCSNFIEIGSGKVLTNLTKRINSNINSLAINTPKDLESLAVLY